MATRKSLLVANWKMNKTVDETRQFVAEFRRTVGTLSRADVVIAPPSTSLAAAADALEGADIGLAAQNVHWEPTGAYTGELSAHMLRDVGCGYVIVAHSERRQYFGETNEMASQKLAACLRMELRPIYCVGETLEEREAGRTSEVVEHQTREGLAAIDAERMGRIVLAYEPVWAIGTGLTASPVEAQEVHGLIRDVISERHGAEAAGSVRILYGGSVKPENVTDLLCEEDIDGALVGGAGLEVAVFARMAAIVDGMG